MSADPVRWRAPGRVNLIGEHTDYNDGFVLPFAVPDACTATVARSAGNGLQICSAQQDGVVLLDSAHLEPGGGWSDYVAGVVSALQRRGVAVPPLSIEVDSAVPLGAGLSSSAALVCSVAAAVDDLLGLQLSAEDLLAVTRSAENDFVGAPTGGMDQLAALRCTSGHALFCDMRTLQAEQVPFDPGAHGLAVLLIDSQVRHRHVDGGYGRRRAECERAATLLGVPALRDVTELGMVLGRLPSDELRRYVRHVVTENRRVLRTVELLRAGRLPDIGPLLTESHASMRDDYRITTPELDVAVRVLLGSGALGARMTGGGFGGCVLALVPLDLVAGVTAAVRAACAERGFAEPHAWATTASAGAHPVG